MYTITSSWDIPTMSIRVITKLPNSEQSYKGKVKTHNYINRQNQSTTGKLWKSINWRSIVSYYDHWSLSLSDGSYVLWRYSYFVAYSMTIIGGRFGNAKTNWESSHSVFDNSFIIETNNIAGTLSYSHISTLYLYC